MSRYGLFYRIVRRWVPEGCILPPWAVALRWILFPLDSAYWSLDRKRGYDLYSDSWLINGVRYTNEAMRALANAQGETYRITRIGDAVTVQRLPPNSGINAHRPRHPDAESNDPVSR